jgi:hypothetical protein
MSVIETLVAATAAIATLLALGILVWTLALRRRHEVYIAPFHVAGGQPDPQLGVALSNMLRARLERLQRELSSAQEVLETQRKASPPDAGLGGIVLPSSIEVPRAVFEPLKVDVSIGKISVGGLLPFLQGWALGDRTIQLTAVFENDRAIVSGDLTALGVAKVQDVWFECGSGVEELITRTAHALLQSRVEEAAGPIAALDLSEFEELLACLYQLAELNRRALSGGSRAATVTSSATALERLVPLTERFPDWEQLVRLGLTVAERAGELEQVRAYRIQLRLAPAPVVTDGADADEPMTEERFVASVRNFFEHLYPGDDPPMTVFETQSPGAGVQAWWNAEQHRYEVNPDAASAPDLPAYVALMGRFMHLHYDACFGGSGETTVDGSVWNDFRLSVVEYLLQTDPLAAAGEQSALDGPLYEALMVLEASEGITRANVRSLALALIDHFACDWTADSLVDHVAKVNEELGRPVPEPALRETLAQHRRAAAD